MTPNRTDRKTDTTSIVWAFLGFAAWVLLTVLDLTRVRHPAFLLIDALAAAHFAKLFVNRLLERLDPQVLVSYHLREAVAVIDSRPDVTFRAPDQ